MALWTSVALGSGGNIRQRCNAPVMLASATRSEALSGIASSNSIKACAEMGTVYPQHHPVTGSGIFHDDAHLLCQD